MKGSEVMLLGGLSIGLWAVLISCECREREPGIYCLPECVIIDTVMTIIDANFSGR